MQDSYIKSRKTYLIVAVILFAWEYFDLRITSIPGIETKLTDGQTELIPEFLSVICLYLAYRVTIDWTFFAPARAASRLDLAIVHFIGFSSLAAYIYSSYLSKIDYKVFDLFVGQSLTMYLFLFLGSFSQSLLNRIPERSFIRKLRNRKVSLIFWSLGILLTCLIVFVGKSLGFYTFNVFGVLLGSCFWIMFLFVFWIVLRIPSFVVNSEDGQVISRINRAFNAEKELATLKKTISSKNK